MPNRKQTHLHLITETGGDLAAFSEQRAIAIEVMTELEDIQGINDDLTTAIRQESAEWIRTIAAQTERIESAIQRLIEGGVSI